MHYATRIAESILPVYVLDSRLINGKMSGGILRMKKTRLLFLLESIRDLRQNLRDRGSDLVVRVGEPEQIIFELAGHYCTDGVFCNRERMPHDVSVQDTLEERLWSLGQEMHYYRGKMLFHTGDLPFPVARTPDKFNSFLKETEHFISVRRPITSQDNLYSFPEKDLDRGSIPELSDFGYSDAFSNPDFIGGETTGDSKLSKSIDMISQDQGEHLQISPWLSIGNLSPKYIYHKVNEAKQFDESVRRSIKRNLILRDYYRLIGKKEPGTLFSEGGFRNRSDHTGQWNQDLLQVWISGNTGHDYVDACMKCLSATGYLNHQQRKAVAHFLIDEMKVHWLLGAGYFESVLLDYDPCSNYGNWQRVAGLSLDLKGMNHLNFDLMGEQMDPDQFFRHKWEDYVVAEETLRC